MGRSLNRVPLMTASEANGIKFTITDLTGVATSFDALGLSGRVPLKIGHNDSQPFTDGQPALGWVYRIYVEGDTLYGDFTDMPTSVYELIRSGAYKFVSVELLRDVQAGTRKLPWVLDAVALLGADQPAFGTLGDLQSLTMKRKPVMQARARVAFQRDRKLFTIGGQPAMTEDDVKKIVSDAVAPVKAALDASEAARKQEREQFAADIKKRDDELHKQRVEHHRDAIKSKFEAAVKDEAIKPAVRESFYKLTRIEDDTAVMAIKLEDAESYITEHTDKESMSRKLQTHKGDDGKDEEGLRADQILAKRAEKLCYSRQQDPHKGDHFARAVSEVLNGDAKLAESYKYMPDTEYRVQ